MSTTFSVIIALYNCEPYIEACLASLVGQTHRDFEAIVVDDCSTDDGLAVAQGAKPQRIAGTAYEGTYIHKRGI